MNLSKYFLGKTNNHSIFTMNHKVTLTNRKDTMVARTSDR